MLLAILISNQENWKFQAPTGQGEFFDITLFWVPRPSSWYLSQLLRRNTLRLICFEAASWAPHPAGGLKTNHTEGVASWSVRHPAGDHKTNQTEGIASPSWYLTQRVGTYRNCSGAIPSVWSVLRPPAGRRTIQLESGRAGIRNHCILC